MRLSDGNPPPTLGPGDVYYDSQIMNFYGDSFPRYGPSIELRLDP